MENKIFEKKFRALGTEISIQLVGAVNQYEKSIIDLVEIVDFYRTQEKIFSRFDISSELNLLNNNLEKAYLVSEGLFYLAKKYLAYYKESGGLFDPRILDYLELIGYKESFESNKFKENKVILDEQLAKYNLKEDLLISKDGQVSFNRRMDFSGLAKGYITDKAATFLSERGWNNFLIDSGGDMYAEGLNKENRNWGIGIEGSKNEDEVVFTLSNQGLATSGNTRKSWEINGKKFHHLINPKNIDDFDFKFKTVSVVAGNTERADFLAKFIFLQGLEGGLKWANENKINCVFLKNDGNIVKSNFNY